MKDDMKVEMEAHKNQQLERIAEFMKNNSKVSNSTGLKITLEKDTWKSLNALNCKLLAQNERLQAELDKVVHKLSDYENALKKIASENDCYLTVADEVLKKWENK